MSRLIITRGLPGSGKTVWARQQTGYWRINRDDLRTMLRPDWIWGNAEHEDLCTTAQWAAIRALLRAGIDVVVDDTNLNPKNVDGLRNLAKYQCADFQVQDFTHVPLETCIERDAARPNPVGAGVIRGMHERYLAGAR